jgi:hypothetical protein
MGDSPDTRRTRAGHSGGITFALPAAPPASACPSPNRPGSVRAAEVAGSSLFPLEWLLGWPEGSRAKRCLGSGPLPASRVSAAHPNPAWRPKQSSLWPIFLQPCTRPSRGTPRRLPVVPLIPDKRYYGESPVGRRRYERAIGDAVPPIPPKTAKNRTPLCKCRNHKLLHDPPRGYTRASPRQIQAASGHTVPTPS